MLLAVACWGFGTMQQALSCLLGGSIIGANLVFIAWTLKKLFQKKSVALVAGVIVTKYAVLFGLIILLYLKGWQADFGFVLGVSAMFPTLGYLAYRYFNQSELNGSF